MHEMSVIIKYEASEKNKKKRQQKQQEKETKQEKSLGPQAAALACLYLIVV